MKYKIKCVNPRQSMVDYEIWRRRWWWPFWKRYWPIGKIYSTQEQAQRHVDSLKNRKK